MPKLTDKQLVFTREYLVDLNATQAAIRAGYSADTAQQIGSENLSKPVIQEAIQKAMDERSKRTEITADSVLQEIAKLAFSNYEDYVSIDGDGNPVLSLTDVNRDQFAAVSEITTTTRKLGNDDSDHEVTTAKVKLADKGINLERLGKHLKLFTDKVEHSGKIDLTDEQIEARIKALTSSE